MQIRELIIDGFGVLINKRITGFQPGINVIYGPNEFGKTSLLEFIRRILFGFPSKASKKNLYEPVNGAPCAGQLICELKSGECVSIRRVQGANNGPVTITHPGKESQNAAGLEDLLGSATKEMYENVYAFSLDELQSMQSLQGDEIKNRIYGAGLGLGTVSINEVEKNLGKVCDEWFKPRGANPQANVLAKKMKETQAHIKKIRQEAQQYESRFARLQELDKESQQQALAIDASEKKLRQLQLLHELYPTAIELISTKKELASLPDSSTFPEGGLPALEAIKRERDALKIRLREEQNTLEALDRELNAITLNPALLEHEHDLIYLQQSAEKVRSANKDLNTVKIEQENLCTKIREKISRIDPHWGEDDALRFQLTSLEISQIDLFHSALESLRQKSVESRNKLALHQERRDEERSKGSATPKWLKYFVYGLMALGGLMAVYGFFLGDSIFVGSALIIASMGVILFFLAGTKGEDFKREDTLQKNYESQCKADDLAFSQKKEEWQDWLKKRKLNPDISPLNAKEFGDRSDDIRNLLHDRTRLESRIQEMTLSLEDARKKVERIAVTLPGFSFNRDLSASIEILAKSFEENKSSRQKFLLFEKQKVGQQLKLKRLVQDLENKETELSRFILSALVKDEFEFREKQQLIEKKSALKNKIENQESQIRIRVGMGSAYDAFMQTIFHTDPIENQAELERADTRLKEMKETRDRLLQEIGETRQAMEQIANDDALTEQQNQWESDRQTLNEIARKWATHQIALYMLSEAKSIYEKTRQPGVIKSATAIFDQITANRYAGIFKPAEHDDIIVQTSDGKQKGFLEMSRGAREQLYLSMRLGLIEEYETRSEPLPIIMDDVFVNFDDKRAKEVIAVLNQFAQSRQVILMTCHHWSATALQSAGAHMIEI
ncbi:MAG: hypothetical protein COV66_00395 [Nitrospinae bacterium CG11_big_fil_rev_8_21_14_0_20_45_15]|nr:MAG: hypothetical protein COV66_00395 [Nitrospinae bacterium CG11_big_fil_rev_8_21_14_0_20_45_15]